MPYYKCSHYTVYLMNNYNKQFEIVDSWDYTKAKTDVNNYTRSTFHIECDKIVSADIKYYFFIRCYIV